VVWPRDVGLVHWHADELFQRVERSSEGKEGIFIERSMEDTIDLCERESEMKLHADVSLRFDRLTLLSNVKRVKFGSMDRTQKSSQRKCDGSERTNITVVPVSVDQYTPYDVVELAEGAKPDKILKPGIPDGIQLTCTMIFGNQAC
jgi:hypothetical protein